MFRTSLSSTVLQKEGKEEPGEATRDTRRAGESGGGGELWERWLTCGEPHPFLVPLRYLPLLSLSLCNIMCVPLLFPFLCWPSHLSLLYLVYPFISSWNAWHSFSIALFSFFKKVSGKVNVHFYCTFILLIYKTSSNNLCLLHIPESTHMHKRYQNNICVLILRLFRK